LSEDVGVDLTWLMVVLTLGIAVAIAIDITIAMVARGAGLGYDNIHNWGRRVMVIGADASGDGRINRYHA